MFFVIVLFVAGSFSIRRRNAVLSGFSSGSVQGTTKWTYRFPRVYVYRNGHDGQKSIRKRSRVCRHSGRARVDGLDRCKRVCRGRNLSAELLLLLLLLLQAHLPAVPKHTYYICVSAENNR